MEIFLILIGTIYVGLGLFTAYYGCLSRGIDSYNFYQFLQVFLPYAFDGCLLIGLAGLISAIKQLTAFITLGKKKEE